MFARKYRLPSFIRLKNPIFFQSPIFILRIVKNNLDYNRFGFIAGKSVDKRAVIRNKAKRKIRARFENVYKNLKQGYDFLFIIKRNAIDVSAKELNETVKDILSKI